MWQNDIIYTIYLKPKVTIKPNAKNSGNAVFARFTTIIMIKFKVV